jgi:hypothetical protein
LVYGDVQEIIPTNIPKPLGKNVLLTHYSDANLYHNIVCKRAVTGVLNFINGTPIEWYSKRQAIVDLRLTLRYLGVSFDGKSHLFI